MNRNKIKMNKNLLIVLAFLLFNIGYGQKTWTGATSTAWDTDSNWSPLGRPTSTENVLITNSANQPVISITGATCAILTLSNSIAGTTVALTVKTSTNGTFSPASIIMNSSGGGTSICSLNINTGRVVTGNVTMNLLQNNVTFSDDGTLFVGGIMTGGTLNVNDKGTVNYSGSGIRDVGTYSYNDLTISGSGTRTISSGVIVNGTFTMGGSAKASAAPTYGANASLLYNSTSALTVGPEWVNPFIASGGIEISNPTLDPGASVVTINDGLQKMLGEGVSLVIDEEATLVTNADIYLEGDLMNNRGSLKTDGYVYLAGNRNQSIDSFTAAKGVVMNKTGGVATFTEDITSKELIINGQGTLNLGGIDRTHTFTNWIRTQGTLNGGSSTLKFSGNVIGTGGDFVAETSTVEFNGGVQNLGSGSITYNNLVLSNGGVKTFGAKTTINETITIKFGTRADLTANLIHSAKAINLDGIANGGSWGNSLSNAVNKNNIYFVSTNNGIINVGPTIAVSTTSLAGLTSTYGAPSALKNDFTLSGIAMAGAITVTAPAGFEVSISTDGTGTFSDTLTIGAVGAITETKVYVRLKGNINAEKYSGNIVLTSNGTTTINIAIAESTVNKAPLLITPLKNTEINYGDAIPTAFTTVYTTLVNNDTPTKLGLSVTIGTTAVKGSDAGTYPITVSGPNSSSNYDITYVSDSLKINPIALTIKINNVDRDYGTEIPTFTASYVSLVNNDTPASLGASFKIETTAVKGSNAGTYPITVSGIDTKNYIISPPITPGVFTIKKVELTIKADTITKIHGQKNPDFTFKYSGFANLENEIDLTGKPVVTTTADTDSAIGEYPIIVTVNGVVSQNYTIVSVNGILKVVASKDADLSDIVISEGALEPVFDKDEQDYKVKVPNDVNNYVVTPVPSNPNATVEMIIDGKVVDPANPIDLKVGDNPITINVKAEDGTTIKTYTVIVTRDKSNNSGLTDLAPSAGTLSPVFETGTIKYTDVVGNDVTSITLTPVTTDPTATITVNGEQVHSGTASADLPLKVGENEIKTVVTAEDGTTTTYTVVVTRKPSNNSGLTDLAISEGTLSPAFAEGTTAYTDTVPNDVAGITVTPITTDPTATITVNGKPVPSGTASENLPLKVGENPITTVITAQDGTITTYTVVVTREAAPLSDNSGLTDLAISEGTLSPVFAEGTTAYTDTVPNDVAGITVTPITADPTATITVNGIPVPSGTASAELPLKVGENEIKTVVTAQDGTITTYIVIVTRQEAALAPDNAGLSDIALSDSSLDKPFNTDTKGYEVDVPNETDSIVITPKTIDPDATVVMTVDGKVIDPTSPIDLKVGDNEVTIVVTAPDGTTDTYIVIVNRADAVLQPIVPTNIITPNGDGKNDNWIVPGLDQYPNNSVKVFDRAARLVYSKNNYNNEWDGTYKGSPLNEDTYYYLIDLGNGSPKLKGFITIIRDNN